MKKFLAKILLFFLVFNLIPFGSINTTFATDGDGTADLNLSISSSVDSTSIIGSNFNFNFTLTNGSDSEDDAFKNGFILNLPDGVEFVSSSDLGSPVRSLTQTGFTLKFFETNNFLTKGSSKSYSVVLKSTNSADLFTNHDIKIFAYADDNIYGRGAVPDGAPEGTLSGAVDFASSTNGSVELDFPDNTDLTVLPFISSTIQFIPFDIEANGAGLCLIGHICNNKITIKGNSLGELQNFKIIDLIPNNRKFVQFTNTGAGQGGSVGDIIKTANNDGTYTLTLSGVSVPVNEDLILEYETLALAFPIDIYTGSTILLNTGTIIQDNTTSINTVTQIEAGTWNNGSVDVDVNSESLVPNRNHNQVLAYSIISKTVDNESPVIGETITYTLNLNVARNVSFGTDGEGSYITDILPDGLVFSGETLNVNNGSGEILTLTSSGVDADGDTSIVWTLNTNEIIADDDLVIKYQAVVDGNFEGAGDVEYENTESLTNTATFTGTITDSQNNEEWGYTDTSIITTTVLDTASADITAPIPTNTKHLVAVEFPDGSLYCDDSYNSTNSGQLLEGAMIPVGSKLIFAVSMEFPNVLSTGAIVKDALPLLTGPNDSVYNFAFQTGSSLKDMYGNSVIINDDDNDGNADISFNGLDLTSTGWIDETPANNVEFSLGSGTGAKTFSILFTADILPAKPSGYNNEGYLAEKNVSIASFKDDEATLNNLEIREVPFNIALPAIILTKTMSGTDIEAGSNIDYSIEIKNTGESSAFVENILDTLPENLTLVSSSMTASGFTLTSSGLTQSGNTLSMEFNTGATRGRSVLPEHTSIIIDYSVLAGTGLIINDLDKTNIISLDYYSTNDCASNGVYNFGPLEATSSFQTKQPEITRELISTSETGSSDNNLEYGEQVTFKTIITLPGGTYEDTYFRDIIDNAYLNFITGSVVSYSGDLDIENSTGTGTMSGDEFKLLLGDIVNNNLDIGLDEKIIINTIEQSHYQRRTNKKSKSRFNAGNDIDSIYIYVNIIEPNIILNKSLSGVTTGDAGDILTYNIEIPNTSGNANAYDLVLTDNLDSRFTYVTGSLVLDGFSGTGSDLFSSTGLLLSSLNDNDTKIVSYDVLVNDNISPADIIPNTANIRYDSLDGDNVSGEKVYTGSSEVDFRVTNIGIEHNIISTNNPDTGTDKFNPDLYDLAIGEQATYRTTIVVPEATFSGMIIKQTLVTGFDFLTGTIDTSSLSHSLSGITLSGNIISFSLGDIINPSGSGSDTIDLYSIVVANSGSLSVGQEQGLSTLESTWDTGHSYSKTTNLDIVEPNLIIIKDYDISTGDGGDSATTTITITNSGTAIAYELEWTDEQPSDVTTTGSYVSSSGVTSLGIGESISYSYTTILDDTVTSGQILTGTASVNYTSFSGSNTYERLYNSVDIDSIQVVTSGSLIATLNTVENVKIGDVSNYTIKVPVAEGTTDSIKIEDLLPTGIAVDTGSIIISHTGITLTGSNQPTFTSTGMIWEFTEITNSDDDNGAIEEIIINFNTVLLNTLDNNIGDTKNHQVKAFYNGGDEKNASTNNITVIESNILIEISNDYNQATSQVKYVFTITNTGTAVGYDLELSSILPSGVTFTGTYNITNTGGSNNLTRSGNIFRVDSLAINTGSPFTFEIYADVDDSNDLGDTLTLTGEVVYTSQSGSYTSVVSGNSDNTERNGSGGVNDYNVTDFTSFIYQNAILNEEITVVDDNGGAHLGGETYTYTNTLTNSGNVDLTDIEVIINIPEYLSGATFTLESVPGGSTNSYTSTGGIYNNGELTLSGIDIAVGDSVSIIYKIDTLPLTPDNTNINTVANVGDTPEGAIGGIPNISFVVIAPELESTSVESDNNGGSLYQNENITHTSTIKNVGSSTGTNLQVQLTYNTGTVSYISGSLEFQSGSLIDTGSIIINDVNGTIDFTITNIGSGNLETIVFKTKATGNVGDKVKTTIIGFIDEGFTSNTISNELEIVAVPTSSSSGGGGSSSHRSKDDCPNGDYTSSRYDNKCGEKEVVETEAEEVQNETNKDEEKKKVIIPNKDKIKKYVSEILEKKKLLEQLEKEELGLSMLKALPEVLPKTGTKISDRISTKYNSKVNTSLPNKEIFRLAGSNNIHLEYWKQVLPKTDQNAGKYIVIPSNGLIVPINTVNEKSKDFDEMINGREINVNKYLQTGVVEYPGTSTRGYGEVGNKVIFGHSSYWNRDEGRYKTHFQKIIELDKGEEVWIYEKDLNGNYDRYKYIVTESYNTPKTDVEVLNPGIGKNLTLFTCTPIGGVAGRWIIKAKYIDETIPKLKKEVEFTDVSLKYKRLVNKIINKIISINDVDVLYSIYNKVEDILITYKEKEQIIRIFELLKYRLSIEILKIK